MSVGSDQNQGLSRDAALIALAHARDQIAIRADRLWVEPASERGAKIPGDVKNSPSISVANPGTSSQGSLRGRSSMWGLLGLGALVPVGAIFLAWHLSYRTVDVVSSSTSSLSKKMAPKVASFGTGAAEADGVPPRTSSQLGQHTVAEVPSVSSSRPDLAQSVATMAPQLAESEKEIDRLKANQAQMLLDNAELEKHLTATQELARRNADLIRDLESAQSQMTQANVSLAAQLRASQEQVTNLAAQLDTSQVQMANMAAQLKANQDQIARLVEHKQRSKPVVSAALPTSAPPKPSSKPPLQQLKPQRQNPAVTPSR